MGHPHSPHRRDQGENNLFVIVVSLLGHPKVVGGVTFQFPEVGSDAEDHSIHSYFHVRQKILSLLKILLKKSSQRR